MKFDVVLGNPPYQKDTNAKRWVLWHEFVQKASELSDKVALVVPSSITSPCIAFQNIKNGCKLINFDVKQHFKGIGSTFCYYFFDANYSGDTTLIQDGKAYAISLKDKDFLPPVINEETIFQLSILEKKREWKRGEFHTSDKSWQSETGINVYHTNAQTLKTEMYHPNSEKIRVAITLSGYPKAFLVVNEYVSQACFWTELDTIKEAEAYVEECNSERVQSILNTFKWSGWNSKEVISML